MTCSVRWEAIGRFSHQLADMVSEPIFDIAGTMEAALHQRLDSELAGGAAQRGEESVPFKCDFRVGRTVRFAATGCDPRQPPS